jgi:hypothetical protein
VLLLRAAEQGYGFHYALADEQAKKQRHQRAEATGQALRAEETRVIGKPHGYPYTSVERAVDDLATPEGNRSRSRPTRGARTRRLPRHRRRGRHRRRRSSKRRCPVGLRLMAGAGADRRIAR